MRRLGLFGVSGVRENQATTGWWTPSTPAATTSTTAPAPVTTPTISGPNYDDVSKLYREALASLTNDTEKMYQAGKRRSLSDIAMQSVNSGMANTLNMPAADIAYDEANRPATNLALGQAKAGILTGLGQTAAGMYGTNIGAQTALANAQLGANTSLATAQLGANTSLQVAGMNNQVNYAQMALERYLAELRVGQSQGSSFSMAPGSMIA